MTESDCNVNDNGRKVGLLHYFDNQQREQDRTFDAKIATQNAIIDGLEKAVGVAKTESDRRLEGMNEFRAQLDKQAATFVTRSELFSVAGLAVGLASIISGIVGTVVYWIK